MTKKLLKLLTLTALGMSAGSLLAQTAYIYPATAIAPRGSYQTVTSIINGVNDKTVTWTTDGGTIVGTNPCVKNEPCTIALYSAATGTFHLTATSNANPAVTKVSTITFTSSPTVVTTHPRFQVTAATLPALQAKATAGNPMYQAIATVGGNYFTSDSSIWTYSTWSGSACTGGSGPSSPQQDSYRENDAWWMTLVSMFSSSSATRNQYGCAAHDIFMTNIGYVLSGTLDLSQGNRWADGAQEFAFTADYLMAGGYLSSSDLVTVRAYAAKMEFWQINNIFNGTLAVIGNYNSSVQFQESNTFSITGMRAMGNNYTQARVLIMSALALTFNDNPTDDPPLSNTCSATPGVVCPDGTAYNLHAYWKYVSGGLLYKDWANLDDPTVVQQAYNTAFPGTLPSQPNCQTVWGTPIPCLGISRGGESAEGTAYGASLTKLRAAFNAIHTAGWDDPLLYGPQMSLGTSSYWDLRYVSDAQLLVALNGLQSEQSRWSVLTDGDTLYYFTYPSSYSYDSAMLAYDSLTGRTDRANALEWTFLNTSFGMAAGTVGGCGSYCGYLNEISNDYASQTVADAFIALPAANPVTSSPPTDPRSGYPTDWFDYGNQHVALRNNWTTGANTLFSLYCTDTQIDHEHQMCGRFDVLSNGEYITKGSQEFNDYNGWATTSYRQNTLDIINSVGTGCSTPACYPWYPTTAVGGQFWHGNQLGLNTFFHSELPAYAAMIADDTNSYNGGSGGFLTYNDAQKASRSLVYLRGTNQVVTYDRSQVGHTASTQTLHLNTTGSATISGNQASWPTRSGTQKAILTSILPAGAAITKKPLLTHFTVAAPFSSIHTGNTMQLTCTAHYADGTTANCLSTTDENGTVAAWSTADSSIATVNSSGLLTAVGTGTVLVNGAYGFPGFDPGNAGMMITVTSGSSSGSATTDSSNNLSTDWEPSQNVAITPSGTPLSAQFLSLLEWGPTSMTPASTFLNQSTAGQNFDGALINETNLVMFMRSWPATFTGTTYPALGGTTHYVSDLAPNTTYTISGTGTPGSATTDNAGVMTFSAAGTGNIVISTGSLPPAAIPNFFPTPGTFTSAQSVSIACTTPSPTIYYTTDGSTPTTSSTVYSSAISITVTTTVKAICTASGFSTSSVATGLYTINYPPAATPTFSPAAGTYTSVQTVTISTTTGGATIYYTTDGSTPTTSSTVYSAPITVATSQTVKAIATATGFTTSAVGSAVYVLTTATPTCSPTAGTYTSAQTVSCSSATSGSTTYCTTDGSTPTTSSPVCTSISVPTTLTLKAISAATGFNNSTVLSQNYTINIPVAATPTFSPVAGTYTSVQAVAISTTTSGATLCYTADGTTPTANGAGTCTHGTTYSGTVTVGVSQTRKAVASKSGFTDSSVGTAAYVINLPAAATPTFSPVAGTYTSTQTVTIACSTASPTMYYTTDGSTPTTGSTVYSTPITVAVTTTVKAICTASGFSTSAVGTSAYVIQTITPTCSPAAGTYTSAQSVTCSSTTSASTTYCTIDGSTPTTSSPVCTSISVAASLTLKAISAASGHLNSAILTQGYVINIPTAGGVVITGGNGVVISGTVTIP